MATAVGVSQTNNSEIDGLLGGTKWSGTISYSFPDSPSDYSASYYGNGEPTTSGFSSAPAAMQQAINYAFSLIAGYTNASFQYAGTNGSDIAIAQSPAANPTSYAYYPASVPAGGDIWFGTAYNYSLAALGNYYFVTALHELGHSLGLKHSQETGGVADVAVPAVHDNSEYTVMSYRSYAGAPLTGYTSESYGYAQTYMANDILALQTLYGANYTTHSENTVYSWNPTTGQEFINGVAQLAPGNGAGGSANRVFETIWDGNGVDTYDLSNYTTAVTINLNPGASSITSATQLAYLGNGHYAAGNIYNAYLFSGDARSYIDNAVGGSGNDSITGNAIANTLTGGGGNDTLTGGGGNDTIIGGTGTDTVVFSANRVYYLVTYNSTTQTFTVADRRTGAPDGTDTVTGVENFRFADGVVDSSVVAVPPVVTVIEANGSTSLTKIDSAVYLFDQGGWGPSLKYGGVDISMTGSTWAPISAEQTASGYQVVWRYGGTDQYSIWQTDSNGNYITATAVISGASPAIAALETSFHQDLNGDGTLGLVATVIEANGSTSLTKIGSAVYLYDHNGSGPSLKYSGVDVSVAGGGSTWTPISAEQTASGYQIVWRYGGADQYSIWQTNSNGNYLTGTAVISGASPAIAALETSFHQDLNGDGTLGLVATVIEANGSTSLTKIGSAVYLYDHNGSGPSLKYGGVDVSVAGGSTWTPISAEQTGGGYQIVWRYAGTDQYSIWQTDSNGNYITGTGVVSGASPAIAALESSFHQDLNGDGTLGLVATVIEANGSTSLTKIGSAVYLYDHNGSGPSLKYGGVDVSVAGGGSTWTPISAEQTASGYQIVWRYGGADQYSIWQTDNNGNYIAGTAVVSGASPAIAALESSFHQDLNGDGTLGLVATVIEANGSTSLTKIGSAVYLYDHNGSGPSLKYGGVDVSVAGGGSTWTPISAEQNASGYQIVWRYAGTDQYSIWQTDNNGNYITATAVVSGASPAIAALESSFHQDLNGDGTISAASGAGTAISQSVGGAGNDFILSDSGTDVFLFKSDLSNESVSLDLDKDVISFDHSIFSIVSSLLPNTAEDAHGNTAIQHHLSDFHIV